jgi:multidrug resistance efflux pump
MAANKTVGPARRNYLLIELDSRDYEVSLSSVEANLASARSKLMEAEAQQNLSPL